MWTLVWAVATIAFFLLALAQTPGDFDALLLGTSMLMACGFGFSLSITIGRWRQERDRKGSQPKGDTRAPEISIEDH